MNYKADKNPIDQLSSSSREPESSDFHQRLASLLPSFKSVRAFAIASGVSQTGLQRLINGGEPTLSTLVSLAKAGGVSVEWLATGEGTRMLDSDASTTGSFATNEPIAHYAVGPSTSQVMDTQGNPVCLEEFAFIPRYNLKASAGYGASTDGEKPLFTMAFRKYWIDNYLRCQPSDLSVISVKGDSMEGVLNDRDVILINHTDNDPGTGLYVLRMDGDLIVKRVQRIPVARSR
ncbi:XRE family transcriptional regulator [Paludibacterium denitrificans]|uniref:XRE family transcriptional regulator n=1 Tax=Paludibacterium denitrificans TaxID=2675226 RepID=UPI001E3B0DF7|nr:helix-turn-helix transcriptional regulator [Paludibacterium denitrificans]